MAGLTTSITAALTISAFVLCGCGHGPKGLSGPAYDASVRAISALERADEHKDDPEIAFTPFLTEYQKAVDEVGIAGGRDGWRSADHGAWSQFQGCLSVLHSYRSVHDGVLFDLQRLALLRLPAEVSEENKTRIADATFELNKCVMEARAFE